MAGATILGALLLAATASWLVMREHTGGFAARTRSRLVARALVEPIVVLGLGIVIWTHPIHLADLTPLGGVTGSVATIVALVLAAHALRRPASARTTQLRVMLWLEIVFVVAWLFEIAALTASPLCF